MEVKWCSLIGVSGYCLWGRKTRSNQGFQVLPPSVAVTPISRTPPLTGFHVPRTSVSVAWSTPLRTISPASNCAFDHQQLAPIGHPSLVPYFSGCVVNTETLTLMSVGGLVVLPQHAAIEDEIYLSARDLGGRIVDVKRIPVADPEVKLAILASSTGCGFRRICRGC